METFEWIVINKDSRHDRKKMLGKIRSHAMKATAASRKKSGIWGKRNQRQYPQYVPYPISSAFALRSETSNISEVVLDSGSKDTYSQERDGLKISPTTPCDRKLAVRLSLESPMPLSGLDQLVAEIGVNVLNLSALTTVQMGKTATSFLTANPKRLVHLVSSRKISYLTHVATRFGSSYCLDDAVRCVATKV
jgi:hypothetical protein